jgi:hypothetical protein
MQRIAVACPDTPLAFAWSIYALFLDNAEAPERRMPFAPLPSGGAGAKKIHLELACGVTVFILAGRYSEVCAKRRATFARRLSVAPA